MFFGKSRPEEVRLDGLDSLLSQLFERKMRQFEPKAREAVRKVEDGRKVFIEACDRLEQLDAQPYTEDLYFASASSIKNQKALYSKTIRKIITELRLEGEGINAYELYRSTLSRIDAAINEMLKTNAGFKTVLYSYSNHFGAFKRAFSGIERSRDELRREIELRSGEAREYYEVREEIAKLRATLDEIKVFRESVELLDRNLSETERKESESAEEKILGELDGKKKELSDAEIQASRLSERISILTVPLERPSRKQDHLSLKRIHLSDFIMDPVNKIKNQEAYSEFITLLNEMKENIENGKIDAKNKEGTLSSISSLIDFDIYTAITSLNSLREKRSGILEEVRTLEKVINDIRKGKEGVDKSMKDIASIKEREKAAEKSVVLIKASIEKMFSDYYRKPILVSL